jgi:hypothetical protein
LEEDVMRNTKLKHVLWSFQGKRGRVAVRVDKFDSEWWIEIKSTGFNNPPAETLFAILDVTAPGWKERAEEEFRKDPRKWRVDIRTGMSGCRDFRLRRLDNEWLAVVVTTANIHVSMSGRISGVGPAKIGELAPLLATLREFHSQVEVSQLEPNIWGGEQDGHTLLLKVVEPDVNNFKDPDVGSGLI